ncbi:DnaA regulatory inactivator Hda [Nitrincola alkalilacustris]|uniref:DnaA regulatory inactivator Hda n=1 Tax=Nitrincola alkalilacustris TaxID=1571224 RepID=UPI00124DB840|nr:DnaA regulatory inactivator Hda [Nitrincola alkalilacustris]
MTEQTAPFQLPLGITLRDDARFENFVIGDNALLFEALRHSATGQGEQLLYIWGQPSTGCSHLLQSCCHLADSAKRQAVYLPLAELLQHGPVLLEDMDQLDLVCIDDIEQIAGLPAWEEAVFHLFNRMRALQHTLLIASKLPPKTLGLKLSDLESRLHWGMVFRVNPIRDDEKVVALKSRAQARGFDLSDEVVKYMMHHGSRDMASLLSVLNRLDHASLSAQRRITVPFVKQVMGW